MANLNISNLISYVEDETATISNLLTRLRWQLEQLGGHVLDPDSNDDSLPLNLIERFETAVNTDLVRERVRLEMYVEILTGLVAGIDEQQKVKDVTSLSPVPPAKMAKISGRK